jgi:hypothetical protein
MPEEYDPTLSAYEAALGFSLELASVDVTEEEIDSALGDLHDG